MKDPTHTKIYTSFDYEPLDDFAIRQAACGGPLGASTWMCVRAAYLLVFGRTDVAFVGTNYQEYERLRVETLIWCKRLGLFEKSSNQRDNVTQMVNDRFLCWLSIETWCDNMSSAQKGYLLINGSFCGVLDDTLWAQRLKRRVKGPFEMIREIRREKSFRYTEDRYFAFAEDNEFLMELSKKGAMDIARNSSSSISLIGQNRDSFSFNDPT